MNVLTNSLQHLVKLYFSFSVTLCLWCVARKQANLLKAGSVGSKVYYTKQEWQPPEIVSSLFSSQ